MVMRWRAAWRARATQANPETPSLCVAQASSTIAGIVQLTVVHRELAWACNRGEGLSGNRSIPRRQTRRRMLALTGGVALSMTANGVAQAASDDEARGPVAVLYPDIGEPYRSAFSAIVRGIGERVRGDLLRIALSQGDTERSLANDLRLRHVRTVVALGRSGLKAAASLDRRVTVIAAGVLSVPAAETNAALIQSLAPDPGLLFTRLRAFVPRARRVTVIHDPRQNDWLMRLAQEAARQQGLALWALEADDLKSATRRYQEVIPQLNPRRDALWLPQDSATLDDTTLLPWVLRESWTQGLPVFSSNVAHVRRGALFALYPDNAEMGRQLGVVAQSAQHGSGPTLRGLQALRQVLTAVNARTAMHLGLDLQAAAQPIHLILPER